MAFGWVITSVIIIAFVIFLVILFWTINKSTKVTTASRPITLSSIDIAENDSVDRIRNTIMKANDDICRNNGLSPATRKAMANMLRKDAEYKANMIEASRAGDNTCWEALKEKLMTNINDISNIWSKSSGIPRHQISKKLEEASKFVLFRESLRSEGKQAQIKAIEKIADSTNVFDF